MFVAVNKPVGISSFKVVAQVRRLTGEKKVGHAGTLDPLASGVLVIAVGKQSTTKIEQLVQKEKEYNTMIKLGVVSTTDDAEGEKVEMVVRRNPLAIEVEQVLKQFNGSILQRPPVFSAIHVGGTRAYSLARSGKKVELGLRTVEVREIELLHYSYPHLHLRVVTGPGFYIRSLARDIGETLGCGGYVAALERTRVGDYTIDTCVDFGDLETYLADTGYEPKN